MSENVKASPDDVCECGHRRGEHDALGCFADPEACECARRPGLFAGSPDEVTPSAAKASGVN